MSRANDPAAIADALIAFLRTRCGGPIEGEVFVETPLYGTRASTAIVVSRDGSFLFVERGVTTARVAGAARS